jgi:hypothetical protein
VRIDLLYMFLTAQAETGESGSIVLDEPYEPVNSAANGEGTAQGLRELASQLVVKPHHSMCVTYWSHINIENQATQHLQMKHLFIQFLPQQAESRNRSDRSKRSRLLFNLTLRRAANK